MTKKLLVTMVILALLGTFLLGCSQGASKQSTPTGSINPSPVVTPGAKAPATFSPSPTPQATAGKTDIESAMLQSGLPLKVTEPADAANLTAAIITVKGQTQPGAIVNVNGKVGEANGQGNFSIPISLEDGLYAIDIIATDDNGNQGEILLLENVDLSQAQASAISGDSSAASEVNSSGLFSLKITSPVDGADISTNTVIVKGQTVPGAIVSVNDRVDLADSKGTFSIPTNLGTGPNVIDVVATDYNGVQGEVILLVNAGTGS